MDRLTEKCWRNLDPWECCGQDSFCTRGCHDEGGCTNGCKVPKIYTRLAKYEDAEEQGLLLKLPCKVGDKVYLIKHIFCENRKIPLQCIIDEFTFDKGNRCYAVLNGDVSVYMMRRFKTVNVEEFGKTVFLTKEEAEQALKQMGE